MSFRYGFLQLFLLLTANLFPAINSLSQSYPRLGNPEYTQTVFTEDFSSANLNRQVWRISANIIKSNLYIFTDSSATVNQTERGLGLSMENRPGYTTTIWTPEGDELVKADFIAGEVMSTKEFSYGIFECNATLAYGRGSFPAFWLYNDTMCTETERPEIDIVELNASRKPPTFDINIWYYPENCLPQTSHEYTQFPFTWGETHTFKAIWTPEKIEFWVDENFLKEVTNNGQYWYPYLPQHIVLSQQVIRYGRLFSGTSKIETPQTSWFHWVKVKEFFLAPEIKCPENIWNTVIAAMHVDNRASDITWELTPANIFSGSTSGRGLKAAFTPAGNYHAVGKLTYRFKMPSGEEFTAEKEIRLNGLHQD